MRSCPGARPVPRGRHVFRFAGPTGAPSIRCGHGVATSRRGGGTRVPSPVARRRAVVRLRRRSDLLRPELRGRPDLAHPRHLVVHGRRRRAPVGGGDRCCGRSIFPWLDYVCGTDPRPRSPTSSASPPGSSSSSAPVDLPHARERIAEAARMREEERLRRTSEERLRIARELHDALGHQCAHQRPVGGRAPPERGAPRADARLAHGDQGGEQGGPRRAALGPRDPPGGGESAPRTPALTLDRLDDLAAQSATAGLEVRTETEGEAGRSRSASRRRRSASSRRR